MPIKQLQQTINDICQPGRGILAADESTGTIGKRFATINLGNDAENRRRYRSLLATTPGLGDYVSGVILFEETLTQNTEDGTNIAAAFAAQKIVPGIKVDKGLIPFASNPDEQITQGLDGLPERLETYKAQGARFAKWRDVFTITAQLPSTALIKANAELLARYAAICQAAGIVPIVEPEVLMDGEHTLERCQEVTENVLDEVFTALRTHKVILELMILKPNMVVPGKSHPDGMNTDAVAKATVQALRRTVPAAVPTINFLSGGQTPQQATDNLRAMNALGDNPWALSFSYGRALQEPCLAAWAGKDENIEKAQAALLDVSKQNSAASLGK